MSPTGRGREAETAHTHKTRNGVRRIIEMIKSICTLEGPSILRAWEVLSPPVIPLLYNPNLKFLSWNECGCCYISLWLLLNDSKLFPPFSCETKGLHQPPAKFRILCFISVKEAASEPKQHENGLCVSAFFNCKHKYYQYVNQNTVT